MKNLFFSTLILGMFFISTSVNAQFAFGVKVGVNDDVQKVSLNGTLGIAGFDAATKIGFNIGAFAELGDDSFRFQPEINFTTKGSTRPGVDSLGADRVHKLSYIEIPLQGKYYFFDNDKFSAYGMGGISIGFALSGKVDEDGQDEITVEFDDSDGLSYQKLDVGVPLAAGATMVLGNGKAFIEARYIFGVSKVQNVEDNEIDTIIGFNAKNRTTQFNAGYIFNF